MYDEKRATLLQQKWLWKKMYEKAKEKYHSEDTSPFVYAYNVVCAPEAENGEIFVELCI